MSYIKIYGNDYSIKDDYQSLKTNNMKTILKQNPEDKLWDVIIQGNPPTSKWFYTKQEAQKYIKKLNTKK